MGKTLAQGRKKGGSFGVFKPLARRCRFERSVEEYLESKRKGKPRAPREVLEGDLQSTFFDV